jgi:hypothetical protein
MDCKSIQLLLLLLLLVVVVVVVVVVRVVYSELFSLRVHNEYVKYWTWNFTTHSEKLGLVAAVSYMK